MTVIWLGFGNTESRVVTVSDEETVLGIVVDLDSRGIDTMALCLLMCEVKAFTGAH